MCLGKLSIENDKIKSKLIYADPLTKKGNEVIKQLKGVLEKLNITKESFIGDINEFYDET